MNYADVLDVAQVPDGFVQRNPNYFDGAYKDAKNVIVAEGYPEVAKAYPGCEVIGTEDTPLSTDELSVNIAKMPKADLIEVLKGYGVEVGNEKVDELREMLTDKLSLNAD